MDLEILDKQPYRCGLQSKIENCNLGSTTLSTEANLSHLCKKASLHFCFGLSFRLI